MPRAHAKLVGLPFGIPPTRELPSIVLISSLPIQNRSQSLLEQQSGREVAATVRVLADSSLVVPRSLSPSKGDSLSPVDLRAASGP